MSTVLDKSKNIFMYRPLGRNNSHIVGAWRGFGLGGGGANTERANLIDYPDPRRINIHESIMNLSGGLVVKKPAPLSKIKVAVCFDLSKSMLTNNALDTALDFLNSAALSVDKCGDYFGMVGFNHKVVEKYSFLPNKRLKIPNVEEIKDYTNSYTATYKKVAHYGMHDLSSNLPSGKTLVFFVSDFLYDENEVISAFKRLSHHYVVPVVLVKENKPLRYRFNRAVDPETGREVVFFGTPTQINKYLENRNMFKEKLENIFKKYTQKPIYLERFDSKIITKYFSECGML